MTDDVYQACVLTFLGRITAALERMSPTLDPPPTPRPLDISDLTQMTPVERERRRIAWDAHDALKHFEP